MRTIDTLKIFYPLQTGEKNPILRRWGEEITVFDQELSDFSDILLDLMWEYDGIGLAAPQIGENIAMIATTQRKKAPTEKSFEKDFLWEMILVNPKIIANSEKKLISEEACLSLPGERWDVERYEWVVVEYQDIKGKIREQKYFWFNAFVIQHEIDHLAGVLFTDKIIPS